MYCPHCQQMVGPIQKTKGFLWLIAIGIWFLVGLVIGKLFDINGGLISFLIAVVVFRLMKPKHSTYTCPICKCELTPDKPAQSATQ